MEDVLDISSENLELLKEECKMAESEQLIRYIHIFSELSNQVRYSTQKRIVIEIAVIKLCRPQMEEDVSSILARLRDLEKKIESGMVQPAESVSKGYAGRKADSNENPGSFPDEKKSSDRRMLMQEAVSDDIRQVVENWRNIVAQMPDALSVFMRKARLSIGENNVLLIVLDDFIISDMLSKEERQKEIKDIISKSIGKEVQIQIRLQDAGQSFETEYVDLEQMIHTQIEVEDFSD